MAAPLAGVGAQQLSQIAQQKAQEQSQQPQAKQGQSKFDQALAHKAEGTQAPQQANAAQHAQKVQQTQATQQVDQVRQVEQVGKVDKAALNKVTGKGMDPVAARAETGKVTSSMEKMMEGLEKGQASLDKLINGSVTGKEFSQSELLGLQASMYKYSQELDLTSKVVEKATSALKDTLKTQV
jgi:hypothetical protein